MPLLLALIVTSFAQSLSPAVLTVAAGSPADVYVSGNQLMDGWGQPVRLLGVNRSGTEYACVQGWSFFDGPSDLASVKAMAAWHANVVRVPLNESCWLGINGVWPAFGGANFQTAIKNYVDLLTQQGLRAILELHWSAAGSARAIGQQPMPNRDHSPLFWAQVASAFKDNQSVIFDLFNEPYPDYNRDTAEAWRCWRDGGWCRGVPYQAAGMQELVNSVRATGARNVIMLGGVQYANSLSGWLANKPADPTGNLIAAWHVYNFNICNNPACYDRQAAPVAQQVPLVASEIGENTCGHTFIDSLMGWLDAHGAGYLGWTWDTWDTWGGCRPVLITDYNGTPTAFGAGFRDHLATISTATSSTLAAPVSTAVQAGGLTLYDNGLQTGFTDGSFGFSARTPCDSTAFVSGPCGYTIAYTAWGGVNLLAGPSGLNTLPYSNLEWAMLTNGVPVSSFSALFTDNTGARSVIRDVALSPEDVKAILPGGWVRIAIPLARLNPTNVPISAIQIKNATAMPLAPVTIDDVRLTGQ